MKNTTLKICDASIQPGESISLALPMPEMFSCSPLYMPIKVVHGKQSGPCLLITAAMHGNELNGTEIINRLLAMSNLKRLRGTLIAVPVLNVYGMMNRTRFLPGGVNLDRCFPGSKTGTHAARMAHIFNTEIFSKADVCIDLQTGLLNHSNLPQILTPTNDEATKELARSFNAPVICHTTCEKGMLRTLATKQGKPFLLYEAGEAMRFDEHSIKVGVQGITRVMRKLGMLPVKQPSKENQLKSYLAEKNIWARASTSGISHSNLRLGDFIKKGDVICTISDPFGATDSVKVKCPTDAVVVGKNNLPLVYEGDPLFQLATFPKMRQAASHLSDWKEISTKQYKKQT
jgi:hypothetical protein